MHDRQQSSVTCDVSRFGPTFFDTPSGMDYQKILKEQILKHGYKALIFASESNKVITDDLFESYEFLSMPNVSKETLQQYLYKQYEQSLHALQLHLGRVRAGPR